MKDVSTAKLHVKLVEILVHSLDFIHRTVSLAASLKLSADNVSITELTTNLMDIEMIREMGEEDNAEYDEFTFESNIENEAGNFEEEKKEYPVYVSSDPQTIDQHIYSQID